MKQKFDVSGMSCAACQAHVEKAVSKVEGVSDVSVSLLTNSMNVEFDPEKCAPESIISAVSHAGYGASPASADKKQTADITDKTAENAKLMKKRLWWSVGFLVPLFYLCMGHMIGLPMPAIFTGHKNMMIFALTQLVLAFVVSAINFHYFRNGFKALFHRAPNMDSLIALGASASFIYSLYGTYMIAYYMGRGDMTSAHNNMMNLYFESCAMILTLIDVGKYLEARSKGKTADAVKKLVSLAPKTAIVLRDGKEQEVPAEEVAVGDIFVLRSGASVPCDGEVIEGACTADESALTGESLPSEKAVGSKLMSASVISSGYAKCRCERTADNSTLAEMIRLVEDASATKAPVARLADKISGVFVPVVIGIAVISLIVWLLAGKSFAFSLGMAIAVLVISCPCALGLATPTAITVGTGKAASLGILIKSAEALETAHRADTAVLDKTGTCTEGRPELVKLTAYGMEESELIRLAASAEKLSSHPLARAVVSFAENSGERLYEASDYAEHQGGGITAKVNGHDIVIGNAALMSQSGADISPAKPDAESFANEGGITLYAAADGKLSGLLCIADKIKKGSAAAVAELEKMGIKTVMLTGDNERTAKAVGKELGVSEVRAGLLPSDKARIIGELKENGACTVMVGDGINDAPALSSADVGIALGAGRDIAVEAADIVLMKNDLGDAVTAIKLSKAVMRNIRQNLFWALIYNSLGIPLAAGVFYTVLGWRLDPMFGAAAMSLSSFCVVTNALRLNLFKADRPSDPNEVTLKIKGMMCDHCTAAVEKALTGVSGVTYAKASYQENRAIVGTDGTADLEAMKSAIRKAGYRVR